MKKKLLALLTVLAMSVSLIVGCGAGEKQGPDTDLGEDIETEANSEDDVETTDATENSEKKYKIAVIRNLPSDDHTKQFLEGATKEGEAFGYQVDTFISNGDDAQFQELIAQQTQKDYDGFIISHGKTEYSAEALRPALEKGIKIVTFDTTFRDDIIPDGITSTAQDDMELARLSLDEIIERSENKPARVLKLWYGPGVPPLDRREVIYKQYEEEGKIETVEFVGPSTLDDVQGEVSSRVGAVLAKYPEGSIDAIWGSWDELAKGGYTAMKEAGRTDMQLISVDISNQDINLMMEENSIWKATAAVDPRLIGTVNMRILAKKLRGEETPETFDLEAHLIRQEDLSEDTTMNTLGEVIDGWGVSDAFNEPWMDELREKNK